MRHLHRDVGSLYRCRPGTKAITAVVGPWALILVWVAASGCGGGVTERGLAATFEVNSSGALVSIYAPTSRRAEVLVEDASGTVVARVQTELEAAPDGASGAVGVAELTGLAPNSRYQYQVELTEGTRFGPYLFRTAPESGADTEVFVVYSADIDVSSEFESPIFETLAATEADFLLTLGDWPYADNFPACETAAEFHTRHFEVRAPERIQTMLRALPVYATWDDHEALNDWNGNHRVEIPERIRNAEQIWDRWFPLRATQAGQERRYRNWRWGRHLELFMLDTRCCRSSNQSPDGPDKTMLGADQKQWLIDAISASQATFKVIVTSVPLSFRVGGDNWNGYTHERDQILAAIAAQGITGVVSITGDGHRFTTRRMSDWGLREFMVGPLARHPSSLDTGDDPERIAQAAGFNFGEIRILPAGSDGKPALIFVARDAAGTELYRERLHASELVLNQVQP